MNKSIAQDNLKTTNARLPFMKYMLLIVIVIELVIGYLLNPVFLTTMNITVILFACTLNGIMSIGQSLVLIAKEIDLSVGANLIFAPVFGTYTADAILKAATGEGILQGTTGIMTGGWALVVVLTLVYATAVGLGNGFIVTKLKIPAFIATIGMQFVLKGLCYIISNGVPIFMQGVEESKAVGNYSVGGVVPISVILFVAIGLFFLFLCTKTKFGMRLYATGGNLKAAKLSGINTDHWKRVAYVLSGLLVGVASIMYMSRMQGLEISQTASGMEMNTLAIAIIGGISISGGSGSIAGTIQATFILAILLNILNLMGLMQYWQQFITGALVVVIAVLHKRADSKRLQQLKIIEI